MEMRSMEWDVFISHAWEDKEAIARPLADGLRARGITVWFDEFALTVGDSLRRSIDHGLAQSRFGIVVISKNFLRKEWPQKELDGLVAREVDGIKVILPVWHEIGAAKIRSYSPLLADRLAASSDKGLDHVIEELIRAIRRDHPAPRPEDKPDFPASPPEATPHAPTADEIADVLERRLRVARAGDGPYSQLTNAELRKHVIEITQKMRKLEREQRAQSILHDLNLSDEQKRAAAIEDYLEISLGLACAVSNIPFRAPTHFIGRKDKLLAIEKALKRYDDRVVIVALHGLRGVGKTALAIAYAEHHRSHNSVCRATWLIRAQTELDMRDDLVALGVRLNWISTNIKEIPALNAVMERLSYEGKGILLIFDNALDADALRDYLPRGGATKVLITSNFRAWRKIAVPLDIRPWREKSGADYLIARTGRKKERSAAKTLSKTLGGLPLAHEQAAAYCEKIDVSFAEYRKRFEQAPARLLDDKHYAPLEYHGGRTVAKTFTLAINEAAKLHPAAESLIVHAAFLAPEPIPRFLFTKAREKFAEPLASALAKGELDMVVAALDTFALIDPEDMSDEREPTVTTRAIRLHPLVREVTASQCEGERREDVLRALIEAMAVAYPLGVYDNPKTWPQARQLNAHALALVGVKCNLPKRVQAAASQLLDQLGSYMHGALAAYSHARPLFERALEIRETACGPDHPDTATSVNNLARLLRAQDEVVGARTLFERALVIREKTLGSDHPDTATSLNDYAGSLRAQGDLVGAKRLFTRALSIRETQLGPTDVYTSECMNNLGVVLRDQGDLITARSLLESALAIREKELGPEDPMVATVLTNLASVHQKQDHLDGAEPLYERALAIREKVLGPEHHKTAKSLKNLAFVLMDQGDFTKARPLLERALAMCDKSLGSKHPDTINVRNKLTRLLSGAA
jgi:tetratricopeptide (TPR) repeat protein